MPETKKCKKCMTEIDKKAKVCPQCRAKQGGIGKFIVIGLIVIVIIGALASINNNATDTDANKNNDIITLGSEGQSDDLILKVNKVGEKDDISENDFMSYKPDSGKYAIINVTIKNSGKEAISLTNGYFKLITADDVEYQPTILIGLDDKYISFESINLRLDITGNLVFEVPTDFEVSDATLRFDGTGLFTAATNFSLK